MSQVQEKNNKIWRSTRFQPTPKVQRKFSAKGLEVGVKLMHNSFGGKVNHQQSEYGSVGSCRIILNFVDSWGTISGHTPPHLNVY